MTKSSCDLFMSRVFFQGWSFPLTGGLSFYLFSHHYLRLEHQLYPRENNFYTYSTAETSSNYTAVVCSRISTLHIVLKTGNSGILK